MKKIVVGNWKMNPQSFSDAVKLAGDVVRGAKNIKNVEIVLSPPFLFIPAISKLAGTGKKIKLGSQDIFYEKDGAYTGEISGMQLKAYGAGLVIVGHSERRALGETNEVVHKKLKSALESGFKAVLCIGEPEKDITGGFPQILRDEIRLALQKIPKNRLKNLIVAYEPIWAIGQSDAGESDTPENVFEKTILIRRDLFRLAGQRISSKIPVLYGGSVNSKNARQIIEKGGVNGLLVGGASLKAKEFVNIIEEVAASDESKK